MLLKFYRMSSETFTIVSGVNPSNRKKKTICVCESSYDISRTSQIMENFIAIRTLKKKNREFGRRYEKTPRAINLRGLAPRQSLEASSSCRCRWRTRECPTGCCSLRWRVHAYYTWHVISTTSQCTLMMDLHLQATLTEVLYTLIY